MAAINDLIAQIEDEGIRQRIEAELAIAPRIHFDLIDYVYDSINRMITIKPLTTMKRLLTIALMLLAGLTASAQGEWAVSHRDADPMKNQDERDVYIYASGGCRLVIWDWDKADFRLISDNARFRYTYTRGMKIVPVKVGLFDENEKMENMQTIELIVEDNSNGKWVTTAQRYIEGRKHIREVMKRLRSGKGYVRFLGELFGGKDFDMKVIPFQPDSTLTTTNQ